MSTIDDFLKQRRTQQNVLSRVLTVLNKHDAKSPSLSFGGIRTQLNLLSEASKRMEQIHEDIISSLEEEADIKVHEEVLDKFIESYCSHNERLINAEIALTLSTSKSSAESAYAKKDVKVQLASLELPKFDGNYINWSSFMDLFTAAVDSKNIPDAEKLQYLIGSLVGDAKSTLNNMVINNDNYQAALDLLNRRYNNKRKTINSYISRLMNLPSVSSSLPFRKFVDVVNEIITGLDVQVKDKIEQRDAILIYLLQEKMDSESKKKWILDLEDNKLQSFKTFSDFINDRANALDEIDDSSSLPISSNHQQSNQNSNNRSQRTKSKGTRKQNDVTSFVTSNQPSKCSLCKEDHYLYKCTTFIKMDRDTKEKFVKESNLCRNCFRAGHFAKDCRGKFTCKECKQPHHTMLHRAKPNLDSNQDLASQSSNTEVAKKSAYHTSGQNSESQLVLETAIVFLNNHRNEKIPCRALLDSGSKAFIISEACVKKLGLEMSRDSSAIFGVGNSKTTATRGVVHITMSSRIHDFSSTFKAYVLSEVTGTEPTHSFNPVQWDTMKSVSLADPTYNKPGDIDILLNSKLLNQIWLNGRLEDPSGQYFLQNSKLGWVFSGETKISSRPSSLLTALNVRVELNNEIKKFWEFEELPEISSKSIEDQNIENHFVSTHTRDKDGRFHVHLPFRHLLSKVSRFALVSTMGEAAQEGLIPSSVTTPALVSTMGEAAQEGESSSSLKQNGKRLTLGESRRNAVRMLLHQEKRFKKNPEMKKMYIQFMQEYLQLNHMEVISSHEVGTDPSTHYYIPHHAVMKPSSTTTKLRVVFNASFKSNSGVSLNDILCIGPNNMEELFSLFIQFRVFIVAIIGDIEKYYRQPRVYRPHTDFQRIVWRDDESKPIEDYRLLTPTYGTGPAAFLTNACRCQLAKEGAIKYPIGAPVVLKRFYVDDLTAGAMSIKEGIQMLDQVIPLLNSGCFPLRKIASSHPEVLQFIPIELRANSDPCILLQDDVIKTLGILWHPGEDVFTFSIDVPITNDVITKRKVLSVIAKIFDFLGWIAPVTIVGKIIMQELWKEEHEDRGWDKPVSISMCKRWIEYCNQLDVISSIKIPRCLISPTSTQFQLHGFSDASEKAYAAVIFIRSQDKNGQIKVSMVAAKTRVAPIKRVSIPRLELCGAVLLTRLMKIIKNSMDLKIDEIHCWTDSSVVLYWIQGDVSRWKQFVANRAAEIQEESSYNWHHVRGEENPADCASRGITPIELKNHHLWWHGPIWLSHHQVTYKSNCPIPGEQELELKVVTTCHLVKLEDTLLLRFSKLSKLIFITSCCLRFIHNCKNPINGRKMGEINQIDRQDALHHWIKYVQNLHFSDEIRKLKKEKLVNIKSPLASLSPFLDEKSIIRVGGRLENLKSTREERHPILLPRVNFLTTLIVRDCHESNFHAPTRLLLSTIRQRYWIVQGQDVISKYVKRCVICIRFQRNSSQPSMGHLPSARVNPSPPFNHTGVDYAGPIELRGRNGRGHFCHKAYIAVFVCLATKAVHLEVVSDYSTPAFIATLRRFIARRGICSHLYSDKGSNFTGADVEMKRAIQEQQKNGHESVIKMLAEQGITWHFNPPASPHMGGLWEAAVKSTKSFLRKFKITESFTFEEMTTILCQIEACLNSRPICQLSSDPNDVSVLTPGHLLIGRPLNSIPDASKSIILLKKNNIQRWVECQHQVNQFWNQWSQEYVRELQQKAKWTASFRNIKVDDKVIIKGQQPPANWKLGRVIKTHPGPDGIVRVASVKVLNTIYRVSSVNLCPIPLDD